MSGPTHFPPPPGLVAMGSDDAGACVDGVCAVPEGAADTPAPTTDVSTTEARVSDA